MDGKTVAEVVPRQRAQPFPYIKTVSSVQQLQEGFATAFPGKWPLPFHLVVFIVALGCAFCSLQFRWYNDANNSLVWPLLFIYPPARRPLIYTFFLSDL